jgi:hypothetical protein
MSKYIIFFTIFLIIFSCGGPQKIGTSDFADTEKQKIIQIVILPFSYSARTLYSSVDAQAIVDQAIRIALRQRGFTIVSDNEITQDLPDDRKSVPLNVEEIEAIAADTAVDIFIYGDIYSFDERRGRKLTINILAKVYDTKTKSIIYRERLSESYTNEDPVVITNQLFRQFIRNLESAGVI